jgi:hypothetical protein
MHSTLLTTTILLLTTASVEALGINCRGSGFCNGSNVLSRIRGFINTIPDCTHFNNGKHIACVSDANLFDRKGGVCAFLQGTSKGLSAGALKVLMRDLDGHKCGACGSVPILFPKEFANKNDPAGGILTVNFRRQHRQSLSDGGLLNDKAEKEGEAKFRLRRIYMS